MGGRGSQSGKGKAEDAAIKKSSGGVIESASKTKIETIFRSTTLYKDEILEATSDADGNVVFSYASGGEWEKTAKTNKTNYVTFELTAGAVNGKTFNINWDKVNSVSGQTYKLREQAKKAGLVWDGTGKRWVRKNRT